MGAKVRALLLSSIFFAKSEKGQGQSCRFFVVYGWGEKKKSQFCALEHFADVADPSVLFLGLDWKTSKGIGKDL